MKAFVTLFVSSPNEITHYHMDHTWNFLLQLSGRKTVHLFDQHDRNVLRQVDIENFYAGVSNLARREGIEGVAYDLQPGEGVHHPVNAPHWVQNGPVVSVSLSLGLCLYQSNKEAKVHQVNYLLRKLRLDPIAPGKSVMRDDAKQRLINLFSDRDATSFNSVVYSGFQRLTLPARAIAKLKRIAAQALNRSN